MLWNRLDGRHVARGGAVGWALGSLTGLGWALTEVGLSPLAVTGWALGASAGSLLGAAAGTGLSLSMGAVRARHLRH